MKRILLLVCLIFWVTLFGLVGCYADTGTDAIGAIQMSIKGTWKLTNVSGYEQIDSISHPVTYDETFAGIEYIITTNEIDMIAPDGECYCKVKKWRYNDNVIYGPLYELDAGDWICYEPSNLYTFELIKVNYKTLILRNFSNSSDYSYNYTMIFQKIKN